MSGWSCWRPQAVVEFCWTFHVKGPVSVQPPTARRVQRTDNYSSSGPKQTLKTKKSIQAAALLTNLNRGDLHTQQMWAVLLRGWSRSPEDLLLCVLWAKLRPTPTTKIVTQSANHVFRGDLVAISWMCRLNIVLNWCHRFHVSCHDVLFIRIC